MPTLTNRSLLAGLYRALDPLCEDTCDAVRIACVPNGAEHRFVVLIDERWRPSVYSLLAERTSVAIPADGGPLNLSAEQAQELGRLAPAAAPEHVEPLPLRAPRRMPDLRGGAIEHTFQ